MQSEEKTKEKE